MNAGWRTERLGDVCDFATGGTPASSVREYYEGGDINWVVSGDVHKKQIWDCEKKITGLGLQNSTARMLPKDSLLIALNGQGKTRGTVAMLRVEAACNQSIVCMTPKNRQELQVEYVYYYLEAHYQDIRNITGDKDRRGLNMPILRALEVPIAPLPEQQRIVGILDETLDGLAAATARAETNLENADALFESHLHAVFTQRGEGWVERTLGDIAQVKGGKRVPKGYKLLTEPTDFPYLRVSDFTGSGTIDMSDLRYVSPEVHREIKRYVISSKDLYLSIAGTIGKTGIIPEELDGANLTENACRLVFNPGISNRFVYYFTQTPDFVEQAGVNTRTSAQPKLALSRLATIKFGIPNLAEQERLADEFDALREETQRVESLYRRKLAALEELKQSLLHQAFAGQLGTHAA